MTHPLLALLRWLWWSFVRSRWSGGGPHHPSYAHATWAAYVARERFRAFIER